MTDVPCDTPNFDALADLDVDTDDLFDVLSNPRRQFVLVRLDEASEPLALGDVARDLAAWERDSESGDVPAEAVESAYLSLYHVHVPKMAEAGVIEHATERDVVSLAETGEAIRSHAPLSTVTGTADGEYGIGTEVPGGQ